MSKFLAVCLLAAIPLAGPAIAQSRAEKVRNDRKKVESEGLWIYNDLAKGFAEGKKSGKPLLVVLRCIPCVECVKLDDDLIDRNARVRPLLEEFVCVRIVSTNGLDLNLFQFDTDQSFAAFLLNADGTIYGRFGTRSHHTEWADDVSGEGLAQAMEGALSLHADYPQNKDLLTGKRGPASEFPVPELLPRLKGRYTAQLDYGGDVVKSCIHCHQIGDSQRQTYRELRKPIPRNVLFPYPHPKSIGLIFDPKERATIRQVEPASPAARAGFLAGDLLQMLDGEPLLSIADVQWRLHQAAPEGAALRALVERDGEIHELVLQLDDGWRERDDISWRATSWELRRMATGGMLLSTLTDDERSARQVDKTDMALRVVHAGEYAPHDTAKKAGFRKDDVVVSFDGRADFARETDLLSYALQLPVGREVEVTILRDGKRQKLTLAMQP